MRGKFALPLVAALGFAAAFATVLRSNPSDPAPRPVVRAARAPFPSHVAGSGIVEASTENIAIGTPVAGIVSKIFVKWGDEVRSGDPLFEIDRRDLEAQLLPAAARVKEAQANLIKIRDRLERGERLHTASQGAISTEDLYNRRYDAAIGEAALHAAQAEVDRIRLEMERYTIRALVSGRLLQIKIHPGEFATEGVLNPPLMLLGDTRRLHVRVDVDENEAWRVRPEAKARVFMRGNPEMNAALKFERIEPFIVPKTALTGESTERTDTRVLQVIYSFDPSSIPLYPGQRVDVFIEAPPVDTSASKEKD